MTPIELKELAIMVIKTVFDPEIPVNIYDLGLIYEININEKNDISCIMTLTSPNCPSAEELPQEVQSKLKQIPEVGNVVVEIVFDPTWNKDMMSEAAKFKLGFL